MSMEQNLSTGGDCYSDWKYICRYISVINSLTYKVKAADCSEAG